MKYTQGNESQISDKLLGFRMSGDLEIVNRGATTSPASRCWLYPHTYGGMDFKVKSVMVPLCREQFFRFRVRLEEAIEHDMHAYLFSLSAAWSVFVNDGIIHRSSRIQPNHGVFETSKRFFILPGGKRRMLRVKFIIMIFLIALVTCLMDVESVRPLVVMNNPAKEGEHNILTFIFSRAYSGPSSGGAGH